MLTGASHGAAAAEAGSGPRRPQRCPQYRPGLRQHGSGALHGGVLPALHRLRPRPAGGPDRRSAVPGSACGTSGSAADGPDLPLLRPAPDLGGVDPEGWQYHAGLCPLQRGGRVFGRVPLWPHAGGHPHGAHGLRNERRPVGCVPALHRAAAGDEPIHKKVSGRLSRPEIFFHSLFRYRWV